MKSVSNAIPHGSRVMTCDGPGKTIGMDFRKASNGGPGTRQYVVELDDGRKRHYPINSPITLPSSEPRRQR